jgi:hypothetical protein
VRHRWLFLDVVVAASALAACLALAERALVAQATSRPTLTATNRAFVNGRVFDGRRFVAAPLYVTADGLFSRSRPSGAEVVDLAGGHVVPPFGEGHNHNTDSELAIERYLKAGIFYVSNPNTHPTRSTLHPRFNDPALVPLIVQRAKTSGLRVAAHVEVVGGDANDDFSDAPNRAPRSWLRGQLSGARRRPHSQCRRSLSHHDARQTRRGAARADGPTVSVSEDRSFQFGLLSSERDDGIDACRATHRQIALTLRMEHFGSD